MSCDNRCVPPGNFPRRIDNRPGLSTIDYRIGSYAELRAAMLQQIDRDPALAAWTHRLPDDPGIALIEAAAEVGDILSFYQDLYANEAYLRTAKWRDSVAALVRLLGYRLAPGIGGRARFAFALKGTRPLTLPAGLGVKAQLEGEDQPAVFETASELVARPALSQFQLYRPRFRPNIRWGTARFTLAPGAAVQLKPGDRLMVGLQRASGGAYDHTQILVVDKVSASFGTTLIETKGAITCLQGLKLLKPALALAGGAVTASLAPSAQPLVFKPLVQPVAFSGVWKLAPFATTLLAGLGSATLSSTPAFRAWKLGDSHRHFGHDAPPTQIGIDQHGLTRQTSVSFVRRLDGNTGAPAVPALKSSQLPLDGEVKNLIAGTTLLVEANLSAASSGGGAHKRLLERQVAQVDRQTLGWGAQSAASTVATLDHDLAVQESPFKLAYADIRGISVHEVLGSGFELYAAFAPTAATQGNELHFYGEAADAAALDGRALLLSGDDGSVTAVTALSAEAADVSAQQPGFHRVLLDRPLAYARFDHDAPSTTVYGNLVEATQGKTEAQVTLGNGDARAVFQTFALPKTPLTYLLDTTRAPPELAQLQVWVDGIAWTRVDSLFGQPADARVYIVREDDAGKSWVQFGDGKTGARLRSGRGNVVALYRSGSGANGPLKADAKPQVDKKPAGLDAAFLLEPVTGGAAPESADGARTAAPGRMQSLGRIVSLADYEAEALAIPGVLKARAAWATLDGTPVVRVTILTASTTAADAEATAEALRAAVRARGANRCPLVVVQGARSAVALRLAVGYAAARRVEDVQPAVLAALGADGADDGLFSLARRQFGEDVHGSQVVAAVQNATGVAWVRLNRLALATPKLHLFGPATPLQLALKAYWHVPFLLPPTQRLLRCAEDRLLTLAASDLQIQFTADTAGGVS